VAVLTYAVTPALELVACVRGDPYLVVLRAWRDQKWTPFAASVEALRVHLDEIARIAPPSVEIRQIPLGAPKILDLMASGANSWWHLDPRATAAGGSA
jgi:hypothetical protein